MRAFYCRQAAKLRDEELHGMPGGVCMGFGEATENIAERLGEGGGVLGGSERVRVAFGP